MTRHDPTVHMRQLLDHAKEAVELLAGKERLELFHNRLLELALVRLIEIVGEAANRVSVKDQSQYPTIPWREIVGMRNRLVHGYDSMDLDILWNTVQVAP